MKATRLNARYLGVEYYKAHDGMDAQEIFCNQYDFTIADNKKVITVYSARAIVDPEYASTQSV